MKANNFLVALILIAIFTILSFEGCSGKGGTPVLPGYESSLGNENEIHNYKSPFSIVAESAFDFAPLKGFNEIDLMRSAEEDTINWYEYSDVEIELEFVSYEVEHANTLDSGVLTFNLRVTLEPNYQGPYGGSIIPSPAIAFKIYDKDDNSTPRVITIFCV